MSPRSLASAAYVAVLLSAAAGARKTQNSSPARPPVARTKPASDPLPQMEQALKKNPDDPKVNVALGVAYLERGENARALERLQHAVKVAPDSAEAHNWLGVALLEAPTFPRASRRCGGDRP